jgi:hypothetical protein
MPTLTRNVYKTTGFISHTHTHTYVITDKYLTNSVRLEKNTAIHYKETKEEKE